MAAAVTRQEDRLSRSDASEAQGVGWLAPRGRDLLFAQVFQARQVVDTRSADDSENSFGHVASVMGQGHRGCRWRRPQGPASPSLRISAALAEERRGERGSFREFSRIFVR